MAITIWTVVFLATAAAAAETNYNEEEARRLLNLASAAYSTSREDCLSRTFPREEEWRVHSTVDTTCDALKSTCSSYIVISDVKKEIVVAFRGTTNAKQLLLEGWQALQPDKKFFSMGTVNRYFFDAHETLWPKIHLILENEEYKDYKMTYTGHSLGGALASIAAARTVVEGYRTGNQVKVITFGQPRVGCVIFARKFDEMIKESYRVVFRQDIVPHLPPCSNEVELEKGSKKCDAADRGKAHHHGTEIWYPEEMRSGARYVECLGAPTNEDDHCSNSMVFHYDRMRDYIHDHIHYFGNMVSKYGKAGCDPQQPNGQPSFFQKTVRKLNFLTHAFGFN